jgi:hypothetical protein
VGSPSTEESGEKDCSGMERALERLKGLLLSLVVGAGQGKFGCDPKRFEWLLL